MKNYIITVNGTEYEVSVEETGSVESAPRAAAAKPAAAKPAAKPAAKAAAQGGAGSVKVAAGAAGKIFKIEAKPGQAVKAGEAIVILEAMKMEIPVVAPQDGTVVSIDCNVGDPVEQGAVLATMN